MTRPDDAALRDRLAAWLLRFTETYLQLETDPRYQEWRSHTYPVCGMRISGHVNPYGTIIQVGLLLGATVGSGRIRGLVELQDQLILSDYGNSDFVASRFIPVRLGLSVRPRAS